MWYDTTLMWYDTTLRAAMTVAQDIPLLIPGHHYISHMVLSE
jgi:hypothetical protein